MRICENGWERICVEAWMRQKQSPAEPLQVPRTLIRFCGSTLQHGPGPQRFTNDDRRPFIRRFKHKLHHRDTEGTEKRYYPQIDADFRRFGTSDEPRATRPLARTLLRSHASTKKCHSGTFFLCPAGTHAIMSSHSLMSIRD